MGEEEEEEHERKGVDGGKKANSIKTNKKSRDNGERRRKSGERRWKMGMFSENPQGGEQEGRERPLFQLPRLLAAAL